MCRLEFILASGISYVTDNFILSFLSSGDRCMHRIRENIQEVPCTGTDTIQFDARTNALPLTGTPITAPSVAPSPIRGRTTRGYDGKPSTC
jgi:hypothetical protein